MRPINWQALERKVAVERQHVGELEDLIQDLRAARFLREDPVATAAPSSPPLHVSFYGDGSMGRHLPIPTPPLDANQKFSLP
jgi:hypothetical protein